MYIRVSTEKQAIKHPPPDRGLYKESRDDAIKELIIKLSAMIQTVFLIELISMQKMIFITLSLFLLKETLVKIEKSRNVRSGLY